MHVKVFHFYPSYESDKRGKIRLVSIGENRGKPGLVYKKKNKNRRTNSIHGAVSSVATLLAKVSGLFYRGPKGLISEFLSLDMPTAVSRCFSQNLKKKKKNRMANSIYRNETARYEPSHHDLHCFHRYMFGLRGWNDKWLPLYFVWQLWQPVKWLKYRISLKML